MQRSHCSVCAQPIQSESGEASAWRHSWTGPPGYHARGFATHRAEPPHYFVTDDHGAEIEVVPGSDPPCSEGCHAWSEESYGVVRSFAPATEDDVLSGGRWVPFLAREGESAERQQVRDLYGAQAPEPRSSAAGPDVSVEGLVIALEVALDKARRLAKEGS